MHGNKVIIQNNVHLFWTVRHEEINIYFSNYISYLFNKNISSQSRVVAVRSVGLNDM